MPRTGYVYSPCFLEHDTGPSHPERSDRLLAIHERLVQSGLLTGLDCIDPRPANTDIIERVHARTYIDRFRCACERGERMVDTPDCRISRESYHAALAAVGGVLQAVDAVMEGRIRNAFCAVRPPGHHAERTSAMGFCYFNNIAIAAEHLRTRHSLGRVAILDWDVHHGNGTQHHFESDPSVFFCSIHQDPTTLFPGTGFETDTGYDQGAGYTLNLPMMPGSGDDEYRRAFEDAILPALRAFEPEFLLVSAGFDPHRDDPLAQIRLTTPMFEWITRQYTAVAAECCRGRTVSVLEGGYALGALADCAEMHVRVLSTAD